MLSKTLSGPLENRICRADMQHKISIVLLFFLVLRLSLSFDVSFIPNDENSPLPLSQKYRDSLRKLCSLLKTGSGKLPPELTEKKATLEKMCAKLAKDDSNISSSNLPTFPKFNFRALAFSLLGVGGGYIVWNNRHWIGNNAKKILQRKGDGFVPTTESSSSGAALDPVNAVDMDLINRQVIEAREARLKRFAEINVNANIN